MALTKVADTVIDAWAEVAAASYRIGAAHDVSGSFDMVLLIDAALSSTAAMGTSPEIICQMSVANAEPTTRDQWTMFSSFGGPVGTAVTTTLSGDEAAGQVELGSTNPVTAGFDDVRKDIFIEDTVDVTKSEIVDMISSSDGDDDIHISQGLANAHTAAGSALFTINAAPPGNSAVAQYVAQVPFGARWVRVEIRNHDSDATLHTRTRIAKVTALS